MNERRPRARESEAPGTASFLDCDPNHAPDYPALMISGLTRV